MRVCVSRAAEAMGENHGGPSAVGNMVGFEKRSILVDGNCGVVHMSREKAGVDLDVSKRRKQVRSVVRVDVRENF